MNYILHAKSLLSDSATLGWDLLQNWAVNNFASVFLSNSSELEVSSIEKLINARGENRKWKISPDDLSNFETAIIISFVPLEPSEIQQIRELNSNLRIICGFDESDDLATIYENLNASDLFFSPWLLEEVPYPADERFRQLFEAKSLYFPPAVPTDTLASQTPNNFNFLVDWSPEIADNECAASTAFTQELSEMIKLAAPDCWRGTSEMQETVPTFVVSNRKQTATATVAIAARNGSKIAISKQDHTSPFRFAPFGFVPNFAQKLPSKAKHPRLADTIKPLIKALSDSSTGITKCTQKLQLLNANHIWDKLQSAIESTRYDNSYNLNKLPYHLWLENYPPRSFKPQKDCLSQSWLEFAKKPSQLKFPELLPRHLALLDTARKAGDGSDAAIEQWATALLANRPEPSNPLHSHWQEHFLQCVVDIPNFVSACAKAILTMPEPAKPFFSSSSRYSWPTCIGFEAFAGLWEKFQQKEIDPTLSRLAKPSFILSSKATQLGLSNTADLYLNLVWGCASGNENEAYEVAREAVAKDSDTEIRIIQFTAFASTTCLRTSAKRFLTLVNDTKLDQLDELSDLLFAAVAFGLNNERAKAENILHRLFSLEPNIMVKPHRKLGFEPCQLLALIYLVANRHREFERIFEQAISIKPTLAKVKSYYIESFSAKYDLKIPQFTLPSPTYDK